LEPQGLDSAKVKAPTHTEHNTGPKRQKSMAASIEIVTTPTADTPGTTLVLRTATKHYVFGNLAEGTQRAMVQQGTRLLKAQDFFLTGRAEWKNTGGLIGMMLTLADSSTSSYTTTMELFRQAQERGRKGEVPVKPHFNIYGPPNLKHTLGTCRRYIFRKGIPINATEYTKQTPERDENGAILPTWKDANVQVWALSVPPNVSEQNSQAEAELEARRRHFDAELNTFEDHQAPENETAEDREARYDRIRTSTIKFMFDSNWNFDTLVERHISEVEMPAAMFVRNPDTHGYEPYHGPKPGGQDPLPDINVWTRTPWPGAKILALPPTRPEPECVSYIVRSHPVRGQFDVARAKALGVTPGPDFGKLTNGHSVENKDGKVITPDQVMGADRPGKGVAILDVPSVEYVENIVNREELGAPEVMTGIEAIIWLLGPGVSGHPLLTDFMKKLDNVQHVISSVDAAPDRIANDSVAGQATRLGQIDPTRYATPVFDNSTVPQKSLFRYTSTASSSLPTGAIPADRGLNFTLMPKFIMKKETVSPLFDPVSVRQGTAPEVLQLAQKAQESVQFNRGNMLRWRQLLARPDTEVTTLGTGSALPSKYRNVSATLVRVPGLGNYLFDAGENTLGQLSRVFPHEELVDILKNLRVLWISHLHADHHLGTASVIRAWYQIKHGSQPNSHPIDVSGSGINVKSYGLSVISHSGMLQWLNEYSAIEDFGYSRIIPLQISPNEPGKSSALSVLNSFGKEESDNPSIHRTEYERLFGFSDIQAARVAHCHGAMAVSITFPRSPSDPEGVKPLKISYSGDCRPSYHFSKIGLNTTVLIHEATFDDELKGDAKAKKHSTTSEALGIGAQMNAKAVVLTHFSQRYQKIPVLQTVQDGEQEDPLLNPKEVAEEVPDDEDGEVDPTTQNADNMDMHPTIASHSNSTPRNGPAKPIPSLQHQTSSSLRENERIIKIRNKDMKVAIAFDYMRVKIGQICELEHFNEALNELLVKDEEDLIGEEGEKNGNGKRASDEDEGGKGKKAKKVKAKKDTKRNN
jgi:ribonuclease Z